ncbi:hypothetical protein CN155_20850 [Sinorhizobium meliloti]|nr:hypothetical protein CN155_20850 [Sinorhizobium meliloti]
MNSKLLEDREQHASTGDAGTVEYYVFGGTTTKSSAVIMAPAVRRVGKVWEAIRGGRRTDVR